MKRVLIISPYFPPTNAADMQRIRMSLPYFEAFGWEAEVVTVDTRFSDMVTDPLLLESLPEHIPVHYVKALSKSWTSKIGLGSIALRSLPFYRRYVNALLKKKRFDLIYFSTTQFPVCILGAYWKKRFGVPYVIDMQDPWLSDYYKNKPKSERPPKYWVAQRINQTLEPIAMKGVDGLVSVSEAYLDTLANRYSQCRRIPKRTITFGAFEKDFLIAAKNRVRYPSLLPKNDGKINVVYVGRGGKDMGEALGHFFNSFKAGLEKDSVNFSRLHFYFIGTSYAAAGKGEATVLPVATAAGVSAFVTEITDRIPFYQTLTTLSDADALFVPGSNDAQYTASKIYPYVLAQKPLLALFHAASSVVPFLRAAQAGTVVTLAEEEAIIRQKIILFLQHLFLPDQLPYSINTEELSKHTAKAMTQKQVALFNEVIG